MSNNNIDIDLCGLEIHLRDKKVEIDLSCDASLKIDEHGKVTYNNVEISNNDHHDCHCGCNNTCGC